jgi:putative DNA primase/helicase
MHAMLSLTAIAQALGGKVSGQQVLAPGPGHDPEDLSLAVKINDAGDDIVVHSFADDDDLACKDYVHDKLGLPKWQPKKKKANGSSGTAWTVISEHVYRTAEGQPYLLVKKCFDGHKKQYPQFHWDGSQWLKGKPAGPKIPYLLPHLIAAQVSLPVYLCEGEKDADALAKLGFVTTTASEGAKAAWDPAMTPHFADRNVVILPDADVPGRKHAQKVAKELAGTAKSIRVLDLFPERTDGYDVSEFLKHDPSGARLAKLAREAGEWTPADEKKREDDLVTELTRLHGIDYAKRRKEIAKTLGVGVHDLDKAVSEKRDQSGAELQPEHWSDEPWPDQVPTGTLLDQLSDFYAKHVILPAHGATAMALWCLHAWAIDAAYVSPFLMFVSPEMRCGKSTAMSLLHWTGPRTVLASNISPAAIFRYIDRAHPTLLIDEAETHAQSDEARGILNSGHTRDTAYVIRCEGDANEPKRFPTWAPKAIASIGRLGATLRDRAIILPMKRKKRTERVSRMRGRDTDAFRTLRQQAKRWSDDNIATLKDAKPALPDALNDRAADNWEPLLAIADLAGGEWPTKARAAALALSGEDIGTASLGIQLLASIKDLMESLNVDSMFSQVLVEHLTKDETGPWVAYGKAQKPINQQQVARLLKPYGIWPDQIRIGTITKKGYVFAWFEDAFDAYLDIPPVLSETAKQTANDGANLHFRPETSGEPVSGKKAEKPNNDGICFGVSGEKGGKWQDSRERRWNGL